MQVFAASSAKPDTIFNYIDHPFSLFPPFLTWLQGDSFDVLGLLLLTSSSSLGSTSLSRHVQIDGRAFAPVAHERANVFKANVNQQQG